jgi:hypothetical protein
VNQSHRDLGPADFLEWFFSALFMLFNSWHETSLPTNLLLNIKNWKLTRPKDTFFPALDHMQVDFGLHDDED